MVFSVYLDDMMGQLFALFVLTVVATKSAIGLALLVITFRIRGTIAETCKNHDKCVKNIFFETTRISKLRNPQNMT